MAFSRVTPFGWTQETTGSVSRVTPVGWLQETQGGSAGVTLDPTTGSVTVTGQTPIFSLAVGLTSITGELVFSGNVPSITGASNVQDLSFLRRSIPLRLVSQVPFIRV